MTALIDACRRRDIRLWAEGGALRFDAPKGALTAELRDELRAHKAELIDLLTHGASGSTALACHDDRISCPSCRNYHHGVCLAAGVTLKGRRGYRPVLEPPRRCIGYQPRPGDPDLRGGNDRWPDLRWGLMEPPVLPSRDKQPRSVEYIPSSETELGTDPRPLSAVWPASPGTCPSGDTATTQPSPYDRIDEAVKSELVQDEEPTIPELSVLLRRELDESHAIEAARGRQEHIACAGKGCRACEWSGWADKAGEDGEA